MKKARNIPSYPVYSLQTRDKNGVVNMNIMTYIIPVSMKPKRYIIALYDGTKSLENWLQNREGILQILGKDNMKLVTVLGKKSGNKYAKYVYLKKKNALSPEDTLLGIAGYLKLKHISQLDGDGGDHQLFLCEVCETKSIHFDVLSSRDLVDAEIIL